MAVKIFPFYITRLCTRPVDEFNELIFPKIEKYNNKLIKLTQKTLKIKTKIIENLYDLVPKINENSIKNKFLTVKRDVYNGRKLLSEDISKLSSIISKDQVKYLTKYCQLIEESEYLEIQKNIIYSTRINQLRKKLTKFAQNSSFLKGILLSSSHFYQDLKKYIQDINIRDQSKIELTLIKYLSRMYFKTSPFSTFTIISINKIGTDYNLIKSTNDYINDKILLSLKSFIYVNNYLFRYLKNLLEANDRIAKQIPLQLNKTIVKDNEQYVFIANDRNKEAIQRIAITPALNYIHNLFTEHRELSIFQLIDLFKSSNSDKITDESLENYLKELINYNFLEYNWRISELDPEWINKFQKKLKSCAFFSEVKQLINILKFAENTLKRYSTSSVSQRKIILQDIFFKIRNICKKLHQAALLPEKEQSSFESEIKNNAVTDSENKKNSDNTFKIRYETRFNFEPNRIFFEDTSVKDGINIQPNQIKEIISKLSSLAKYLSLGNHLLKDHEDLLYFFQNKFGLDAKIELLQFYEKYSKFQSENKKETENLNPITNKRTKLIEKLFQKIISTLKIEKQNFTNEVNLKEKHLLMLNPDITYSNSRKYKISLCAYLQLYNNEKNKLTAILNSSSLGYGKMYSRFLYMFNPKITELLREWNKPENADVIIAENNDSSDLNVNMHPHLLPYELESSATQNKLNADSLIAVNDLLVVYNLEINKLQFLHKKSGKIVYFFDLGFQGPMGRSGLFKFVNSFYTIHCIYPYPLINKINSSVSKYDSVYILPRIIYENQVILQRKTWVINKKRLPYKDKMESDADYFFRINKWRLDNKLPKEIFVHITSYQELNHKADDINQQLGRDDYKPQYINFNNPFLIRLFAKIIRKVSNNLSIVEMLPNSDQLLSIGNNRYVSEFLFQWYL